jgi:hypothetical protein
MIINTAVPRDTSVAFCMGKPFDPPPNNSDGFPFRSGIDRKGETKNAELSGQHTLAPQMRRATSAKATLTSRNNLFTKEKIKLPAALQALGDEIRALRDYLARGLLTAEEAQERIDDWQIFYPPGWSDIAALVDLRTDGIPLEAGA